MVIYFGLFAVILISGYLLKPHRSKKNRLCFLFCAFGLMALVMSLRKYTVGIDLEIHYYYNYQYIAKLPWSELLTYLVKYDIGYLVFCKLISYLSQSPQMIIIATSCFTCFCFAYFIYKNSLDVFLSSIVFLSFQYYTFTTLLAQEMAISILLLSIEFLKKDKKIPFIVLVIIAATFHSSAILCLLFLVLVKIPFNKKSIAMLAVTAGVFYLFYTSIFAIVTRFLTAYARYETNARHGVGYVNANSILNASVLLFVFSWSCYYLSRNNTLISEKKNIMVREEVANNFLIYTAFLALLLRVMVFRMNTFGRMSYYFYPFLYLLIPITLKNISDLEKAKKHKILVYVMCTSYFFIITYRFANSLYGNVPYLFYWQ